MTMVSLLFSIHGRVSRGPFWLVFLILLPVISALILLIDTSLNDNPVLMLMALVLYAWIAICITVKTAARYGCDRVAFDPCRFNSDCRHSGRFFSRHRWPKPIWS